MSLNGFSKKKRMYIAAGITALAIGGLAYSTKNIKEAGDKLANISKARTSLEDNISSELSSNYALNNEKGDVDDVKGYEQESKENNQDVKIEIEKKTVEVVSNKQKKDKRYSFNEEAGLNWPINGDVIKNYSIDRLVYFETLGVFKANPGVFIKGEVGQNVKSSCDGRVIKVDEDKDKGKYIQVQIDKNMILTYGQLKDIKVSKGDDIKDGQVIAELAKPSAYYTKEGPHLYFEVKEDNEEINPLVLLK